MTLPGAARVLPRASRRPLALTLGVLAAVLAAPPVQAQSRPPAPKKAPAGAAEPHPLGDLLARGKHQEGLEWLRTAGKGTPEEDRYRGLFHHGLAQPDAALKYLLPAYRARPGDDVVALAVAEASLWKKDHRTAVTVIGQLKAPEAPEAMRVRGMVLEQAGRLPEALELYERAIPKLERPWGTIERKAQVLSWLKRFDEASAAYATIVSSQEATLGLRQRCRVRLAELTAWKKDFDGALVQLTKLLAEAPRSTDALLLKGQILEWKGAFGEAKQAYSRILAIDAAHAEARLRLNKLLWVK